MKKKNNKIKNEFLRYGLTEEEVANIYANKNKINYSNLKKCLSYYKNYKGYIVAIIFCMILNTVLMLFKPYFMEKLINYLGVNEFTLAIYCALFIVVVVLINQVVYYVWDLTAVASFQKVIKDLRLDVLDEITKTKISKFDKVNSGEIINRITNDTTQVTNVIYTIIDKMRDIIVAIGFLIYICIISFWLGLALILLVVVVSLLDGIMLKHLLIQSRREQKISDKNIGIVSEIVRGIRDIKLLNISQIANAKYNQGVNHMMNCVIDGNKKVQFWTRIRHTVEYILIFGLICLGIYLLSSGQIMLGVLLVVLMYRSYVFSLTKSISNIRIGIRKAGVSAERICAVFDDESYPKEKFGKRNPKNIIGKLSFKDVDFSFDDAQVLKNFSLEISPNQSIAIVGKSGQGKSTMLNLITRLYDVDKGCITLDDIDIKELSEKSLRDNITIVPQTPYIFNTTIRENLSFVKLDLTDEEMIEVCKKAQIHDFIVSKKDGYDSIVGENGVILSGGQKQRLAIARALLKNSKIIMLDEATSALDNENQYKIQQIINSLKNDHTIIIVAHRLSTIIDCDKIVFMENGQIIGCGSHKQLLHSCKQYKDLYTIEENSREN